MNPLPSTSIPSPREPSPESEAFDFPRFDWDEVMRDQKERQRRRNEAALEQQLAEADRRREAANAEARQYKAQRTLMRGRNDYCESCDWAPCRGLGLPAFCPHHHKNNCIGATPQCPEDARARWEARCVAEEARRLPTLAKRLTRQRDPEPYVVEGLWRKGESVLFGAAAKAGKTTARNQVAKCFADGGRLFGRFDVTPLADGETVVLLDVELSEDLTDAWLEPLGIEHPERIVVVNLKGRVSEFDIRQPEVHAKWVERIREAGCRVLILDCLAPVLHGLGIRENSDAVGEFLTAWDALVREAGVSENMVIHHFGHNGEFRGYSGLLAWAGALWRLTVSGTRRSFEVSGRVDGAPKSRLDFDPATRSSTYPPGSLLAGTPESVEGTEEAGHDPKLLDGLRGYVKDNPGCSKTAAKRAVKGGTGPKHAALEHLIDAGEIRAEQIGQSHRLYLRETS